MTLPEKRKLPADIEMTSDFDKTMDDLLRQHGRRATARPDGGTSGAHLDADALNAFAGNVLPPATRLRYVTHLADCAVCRHLATGLTLAASANFQEASVAATAAVKPPTVGEAESSWRAWFMALLNPAVLRYAIPAVALFAVTIGAFLALRTAKDSASNQAPNNQVAKNTEASANTAEKPAALKTAEPSPAQAIPAASALPSPQIETAKPTPALPVNGNATSPEVGATGKSGAPAAPAPPILSDKKEKQPSEEVAKNEPATETTDSVTPTDKAPSVTLSKPKPPPPPAKVADERKPDIARAGEDAERKRADDDDVVRNDRQNRDGVNNGTVAQDGRGTGGPNKSNQSREAPKRKASPAPLPAATTAGRREADADSKDEAEKRNAGGRSFIRRGGAWVDTACANGCATTTLKRGSDAYKKADAGLRSIADQLGGEVIVFWQGKAYRIQ